MDCPSVSVQVGYIFLMLTLVLLLFSGCAGVFYRPPRRLQWLSFLMRRVMIKVTSLALMPKVSAARLKQ